MHRLIAAAVIAVAAAPATAQQKLVETIEVRVANIDVVVTDRAGHPVAGLTKDDFQLFDDRAPQTITNFYEVRRGGDPSAAPDNSSPDQQVPLQIRQRRLVIFVDASLSPFRKTAVLQSVEKFIDRHMQGEDQCMLVSWRLRTHVVTPFTSDRAELKRGLEEIAHAAPIGEASKMSVDFVRNVIQGFYDDAQNRLISFSEAYQRSRSTVTAYGEQLLAQQRQLLNALDAIATTMAGMEGKKVLVFVTENVPQKPAADLYQYVNNLFSQQLGRRFGLDLDSVMGLAGNDMPNQIEQLARDASANGVTIYTVGMDTSDRDFSAENNTPVDPSYVFVHDTNTSSTLQTIADVTGGVAITRTSNFDLAFDTIDRDLSSYYSLGYKPAGEGGHAHRIVVKVKNPDYRVRARETFIVKSADEQIADRTVANLYIDPTANQWPISIQTGKPRRDGRYFVIPVEIVIPSTVTLIPQEDKLAGGFTIYFAVGDANGATSTVQRQPADIKIPASEEAKLRAKPMTVSTAVRVRGGESVLSVTIVDQLSGTMGYARASLVAR